MLKRSEIQKIFGQDAAELESPERLKEFFVNIEEFDLLKEPQPISLVVGQKGVGKTALLRRAHQDDLENKTPAIILTGSEILKEAPDDSSVSNSIELYKTVVERSIIDHIIDILSDGALERLSVPPDSQNLLARIASISAKVISQQNPMLSDNAEKALPWIFDKIDRFNVYIDDTDIEWDGSDASGRKISNLISACYRLAVQSKARVSFKISVRSDLFAFLKNDAEYIDKIQGGIIRFRWTNDEVFRVIAKRIAEYFDINYDENQKLSQDQLFDEYYSKVFEPTYFGEGAWERADMRNVLLSFVRQRPRDLITLCQMAGKRAAGKSEKIGTVHMNQTFEDYCIDKMDMTIKEFSSELPEIAFLLKEMRPRAKSKDRKPRYRFSHAEMVARVKEISDRGALVFSHEKVKASPARLIEFMFRINFLVATRDQGGFTDRRYFDFADDIRDEIRLGQWGWEVHMAYRWAIKPKVFALQDMF